MRQEYSARTVLQRAPFFAVHSESFALIAGDTGIRRRFDIKQRTWFEAALERTEGTFTMVLLRYPLVAGCQAPSALDSVMPRAIAVVFGPRSCEAYLTEILTQTSPVPRLLKGKLLYSLRRSQGEPGAYGGGTLRGAPTPRIDQLASDGLRLLNFNKPCSHTARARAMDVCTRDRRPHA